MSEKGKISLGASGAGDVALFESDRFIALITENWINDNGCMGQAEYAQRLGKPMIAVIKVGTKNLAAIDRFPWQTKMWFANSEELLSIIRSLIFR